MPLDTQTNISTCWYEAVEYEDYLLHVYRSKNTSSSQTYPSDTWGPCQLNINVPDSAYDFGASEPGKSNLTASSRKHLVYVGAGLG